jgi:hypothetical protein
MDLGSGNTGGTGGMGGEGQQQPGADFLSALSDDQKAFASAEGFDSAGKVLESYQSLQQQLAGSVALPGDNATPDDHANFYKTVSEKWTPKDGYQFKLPEGLDETFPYDQDFAKEAGDWFKEAGLHPQAAQALHDKWVGKIAAMHGSAVQAQQEQAQKQAEAVETAHRALVKEYGEPNSDGYKNLVAKADRSMKALSAQGIDVANWFAEKGILTAADENGLQQVQDPAAVKLLAFIHDRAFTEDGFDMGGVGGGGNPFDRSAPNLQKQSDLIRDNPEQARRMISAAGRDPKSYGL